MALTLCLSSGPLAPPVRGKFCAVFLTKEGQREERFFVADDVGHLLRHFQELNTTRAKLLISVTLIGVYFYHELYDVDQLDTFPVDFDIAAFCLQL